MEGSSTAAAVSLAGVTVAFRLADGGLYTAVEGASLNVAPGEFVSIVGPTGCGKSTLLNVVAGLLQPAKGAASIFGTSLAGINRHAGYLFQADALFPWKTALENIAIGYLNLSDAPNTLKYARLAEAANRAQKYDLGVGRSIVLRGNALIWQNKFTEAAAVYNSALAIFNRIKEEEAAIDCTIRIAGAYAGMTQTRTALPLEVEAIRDSILSVSGELNPKMFGPSMFPPIPKDALAGNSDLDKICVLRTWQRLTEPNASRLEPFADR